MSVNQSGGGKKSRRPRAVETARSEQLVATFLERNIRAAVKPPIPPVPVLVGVTLLLSLLFLAALSLR